MRTPVRKNGCADHSQLINLNYIVLVEYNAYETQTHNEKLKCLMTSALLPLNHVLCKWCHYVTLYFLSIMMLADQLNLQQQNLQKTLSISALTARADGSY